jgi:hypothetical protein
VSSFQLAFGRDLSTLFAALETLQGKVVGECHERHWHQEFLRFLRRLDTEFPGDVPLHLIMDNYGTHKHAKVKAWLKRHPRFISHFVPCQFQLDDLQQTRLAEPLQSPPASIS